MTQRRRLIKNNFIIIGNMLIKVKLREIFWCNRFYDYSEYRLKKFVKRISLFVVPSKKLLDVGAGELQYKKYFSHTHYKSQDSGVGDEKWDFSQVDIISEIYNIPVEDKSFDYILCTQVMEHLGYPDKAFAEFSRIIVSGGLLFVTCPLAWKEHQKPHDFFRYTQYALKMLAKDNGFEVVEMNKVGGKFITITRLLIDLNLLLKIKNKYVKYLFIILLYPINFSIGAVGYFLDFFDKDKDLTLQYECIFEKI